MRNNYRFFLYWPGGGRIWTLDAESKGSLVVACIYQEGGESRTLAVGMGQLFSWSIIWAGHLWSGRGRKKIQMGDTSRFFGG